MIESSANGKYKNIRKWIRQAKARRQDHVFVVEGWKMVREALERNLVLRLYCSQSEQLRCQDMLDSRQCQNIDLEPISDALFAQLSDTVTPQGILGVVKMPVYSWEELCDLPEAALLFLENIQDPGNLGTMLRTAEGAGMSGVILSGDCVDLFNPKVVRATMGALFRVPYYICGNMVEEMQLLQEKGFHFYAAHLQGKRIFTEESYEGRVGILIGNEANGISDRVARQADTRIKIPMEGELESLNAAVSAALLMYEVHRNRKNF